MAQQLRLNQAVFIGLAAMLGAGLFVVFGPAAELAGNQMLLALVLAAAVSYLNAASIAQLAAKVEKPGGAYAYARVYLNDTWSFLAGSAFLVGKIASAAAIALAVGTYVFPQQAVLIAVAAVVLMAVINILGINRTAFGSMILAIITISFLVFVIIAALISPISASTMLPTPSFDGVLAAAAIFFFAFAGYARVASLGNEVSDPSRNIPRAINISFLIVLAIYAALTLVLPAKLGADLALSSRAVFDLVSVAIPWFPVELVAVVASVAALGSLLALLAGMSRTGAQMATDQELPEVFSLRLKNQAPWLSELAVSALVIALVLMGSLVFAIGISSFAILLYYSIANYAAFRQPRADTSRLKLFNFVGLLLCLIIGLSVPLQSLITGASVLAAGLIIRWGIASWKRIE